MAKSFNTGSPEYQAGYRAGVNRQLNEKQIEIAARMAGDQIVAKIEDAYQKGRNDMLHEMVRKVFLDNNKPEKKESKK